jgi:hypothetical protein
MAAAYRMPLTPVPQTLEVSLAGAEYALTVRYNTAPQGGWVLDIDLPDDAGPVVGGVPLVTGVDLLAPYGHLGIGGRLVVWADDHDLPPGPDDLGQGVDLLFVVPEEDDA